MKVFTFTFVIPLLAFVQIVDSYAGPCLDVRVYRGNIGGHNIEMKLCQEGSNLSGSYFYDGIGKDLTLRGRIDAQGHLALQEFDDIGKQTGKFVCQLRFDADSDPAATIDGKWSRADGSRETFVSLTEQYIGFTGSLRVIPKVITERRTNLSVSYPQLTGGSDPTVAGFNSTVTALVSKLIREFKEGEPSPDRSQYQLNYDILLATDNLISLEFSEYADWGGAHPNSYYHAINYDLRAGREMEIEGLFKPASDYKNAILRYSLENLNTQWRKLEESEGRKPDQSNEYFTSEELSTSFASERLRDKNGWAMTRSRIVIYFDFPHAIAVFNRTFISYRDLESFINPGGPAAVFSKGQRKSQ
jgi:hypothetical protein